MEEITGIIPGSEFSCAKILKVLQDKLNNLHTVLFYTSGINNL